MTDSSNRMLFEDESDDDDYEDFLLNSKASDLKATFAIAAAFAAATTMSKQQMKDWSSLKVAKLKEELKKRGIKAVGKKADLVLLLKKDHHSVDSTEKRYSSNNRMISSQPDTTTDTRSSTSSSSSIMSPMSISNPLYNDDIKSIVFSPPTSGNRHRHRQVTDDHLF